MAVTELQLQNGIKALLDTLSYFAPGSVTINDWSIVQDSVQRGPIVVIENSDNVDSRQVTMTAANNFTPKVSLCIPFDYDKDCADLFRTIRQAILDLFNTGSNRTLGLDGIDIVRISNESPIDHIYDQYDEDIPISELTPVYMYQTLLFECEEF